eukprot:766518-Hanusia_phi.AAC.13
MRTKVLAITSWNNAEATKRGLKRHHGESCMAEGASQEDKRARGLWQGSMAACGGMGRRHGGWRSLIQGPAMAGRGRGRGCSSADAARLIEARSLSPPPLLPAVSQCYVGSRGTEQVV